MDVFLVISGFLITSHLLRELDRTGRVDLEAFWARRIRRLLPAAAEGTDYLATQDPSVLQHYWSLGAEEQFYLLWPLALGALWVAARASSRTRGLPRACGGGGPTDRTAVSLGVLAVVAASLAANLAWTDTRQPWAYFLLPARPCSRWPGPRSRPTWSPL